MCVSLPTPYRQNQCVIPAILAANPGSFVNLSVFSSYSFSYSYFCCCFFYSYVSSVRACLLLWLNGAALLSVVIYTQLLTSNHLTTPTLPQFPTRWSRSAWVVAAGNVPFPAPVVPRRVRRLTWGRGKRDRKGKEGGLSSLGQ